MIDWRTARTPGELLLYMPDDGKHFIERIEKDVRKIDSFELVNIDRLSEFDDRTGERVLQVLLEFACYGTYMFNIELGRKYVSFIPKDWLREHIVSTVKQYFDYGDWWNYRRLLEVVDMEIPEALPDILEINADSEDLDIREAIEDFS